MSTATQPQIPLAIVQVAVNNGTLSVVARTIFSSIPFPLTFTWISANTIRINTVAGSGASQNRLKVLNGAGYEPNTGKDYFINETQFSSTALTLALVDITGAPLGWSTVGSGNVQTLLVCWTPNVFVP